MTVEQTLTVALIVVGFLLIVTVMMQPSKQQDALSALSGGAGDLFAERKSRGFEAVMRRSTAILGGLWFIIGFALMYLSAH
ncbi:preprotein translocase subunit SecG [Leuconostoc gelidum subsp. aenigmaticum]|uniref:Protein-export membrane protein SecG n=2 Tax=Leuconostoc gelidum group TaxID=3016637 RepID=A0A9Q3SYR0_9LACO|nr:preprotein translocase subunit SecG [Leuconostoc gasicomitatum]MBR2277079.1 preprotein translocase subunit SecG [Leuconostoc sp.]MBZ5964069.1 preprotein translocase subunit SecG [Leuconostoc gelidum subsp. gelidum]MBZ6004248.1 preprotein translocase subunit SecG [Leuconostoc gelidum subsp. aenigmaticum]MBZ5944431.1 preprotein translocase subunit SecG [Leuconostoc gasicomitatum]MBZ5945268.1 preprotein translocase subunit SecG [Leuconostoc gasicomitatum]